MIRAETRLQWRQEAVIRAAHGEVKVRMKRAMIVVQDQAKVLINRGNPTGKFPSAPGEPPKKVKARLFKSITHGVIERGTDIVGVIGSDAPYARRLELGFTGTDRLGRVYRQAARPFLRPALAMSLPAVRTILGVR